MQINALNNHKPQIIKLVKSCLRMGPVMSPLPVEIQCLIHSSFIFMKKMKQNTKNFGKQCERAGAGFQTVGPLLWRWGTEQISQLPPTLLRSSGRTEITLQAYGIFCYVAGRLYSIWLIWNIAGPDEADSPTMPLRGTGSFTYCGQCSI